MPPRFCENPLNDISSIPRDWANHTEVNKMTDPLRWNRCEIKAINTFVEAVGHEQKDSLSLV